MHIDEYLSSDRRITSEHVFLTIIFVASTYAFIAAGDLSRGAAIFPRITAGITIVTALLLLLAEFFPPKYRDWIKGTGDENVVEEVAEKTDSADVVDEDESADEEPETIVPAIPNSWATMGLMLAYIGASYLITMFWATPLFALAYAVWFRQPWYIIVAIPIVAFLIAYGFGTYLNFPIDDGVFIDEVVILQVMP